MTPTFIEVCAGAGGLSTGLIEAGFTPLLLNDYNKDCCKTLEHNHPCAKIICEPMDSINFTEYIGRVDLLAGGVPCQSFSQAGSRQGLDDPRGYLMLRFIELIRELQPKVFLIENVKGMLTHDKGDTFKRILRHLQETTKHQYNIVYRCLDTSKYGVPQKRERLFIIGMLGSHTFEFPPEQSVRRVLRDVLNDIPVSIGAKYPQLKIDLFKQIPQGGCWVNLPEDIQKKYLGKSFESGGGKRGILYRLSMDKPCLTLLCSPSQKQTERCHPLEERPLTVREYARIQTFPDDYEFAGSMSSQYKQIGNAVPVLLAKQIGEAILKCIC